MVCNSHNEKSNICILYVLIGCIDNNRYTWIYVLKCLCLYPSAVLSAVFPQVTSNSFEEKTLFEVNTQFNFVQNLNNLHFECFCVQDENIFWRWHSVLTLTLFHCFIYAYFIHQSIYIWLIFKDIKIDINWKGEGRNIVRARQMKLKCSWFMSLLFGRHTDTHATLYTLIRISAALSSRQPKWFAGVNTHCVSILLYDFSSAEQRNHMEMPLYFRKWNIEPSSPKC